MTVRANEVTGSASWQLRPFTPLCIKQHYFYILTESKLEDLFHSSEKSNVREAKKKHKQVMLYYLFAEPFTAPSPSRQYRTVIYLVNMEILCIPLCFHPINSPWVRYF